MWVASAAGAGAAAAVVGAARRTEHLISGTPLPQEATVRVATAKTKNREAVGEVVATNLVVMNLAAMNLAGMNHVETNLAARKPVGTERAEKSPAVSHAAAMIGRLPRARTATPSRHASLARGKSGPVATCVPGTTVPATSSPARPARGTNARSKSPPPRPRVGIATATTNRIVNRANGDPAAATDVETNPSISPLPPRRLLPCMKNGMSLLARPSVRRPPS